jgi:hypothetical protein
VDGSQGQSQLMISLRLLSLSCRFMSSARLTSLKLLSDNEQKDVRVNGSEFQISCFQRHNKCRFISLNP